MISRKNKPKLSPIKFEDAVNQGIVRIVTNPTEIKTLVEKERHEMGYRNFTDKPSNPLENDLKYSDMRYVVDSAFNDMIGL